MSQQPIALVKFLNEEYYQRKVVGNGVHARKHAKKIGLSVIGSIGHGKGDILLIDREQANEVLARRPVGTVRTPDSQTQETDSTTREDTSSLHLGALETKVDRTNERILAVEQAINTLVRATNLMTDRLANQNDQTNALISEAREVLKQLR